MGRWNSPSLLEIFSGGVNLSCILETEFRTKTAAGASDDDFDLVMSVNVRGIMACQRAQLRYIEGGGSMINAAGIAGKVWIANCSSYGLSKQAVVGLTRVAAAENGHRNVRGNAIAQ